MISRIELGKKIREELPKSPDEWITVQSLEDVKLGNFAWKSQRYFFMRIFPPFAKYHYETATEKLEEYLQRRNDDVKFELKEERPKRKSLSATAYDSKQAVTFDLMKGRLRGGYQNSYQETIPATDFIITRIKRRDLEQSLNLWKLDMTSSYINVKKRKNDIPCIISAIVEAATPEDQPDTMASVEKKRRIEENVQLDSPSGISDVLDSVKPKGNIVSETCKKTEGYIKGPVLYNVLPLEIDPTGHIEAKEDSEGFLEDTVVADSASGNFSSTKPDPTLSESFEQIEEHLQPVMEDKSVGDAFKSISFEDIDYLCRLFERVQDSPNDVEEPGQMSSECRTIWEFAKCQRQESDEKYRHSLTSCYYLAAVLAEVPTSVRQLFDQTTVNLFPLLKDILLGRPRKDIVINDDILKCNKAKALLEMLDICTKESVVVAIPASQKLMVNAVWIAMLYGWHSREEQQ